MSNVQRKAFPKPFASSPDTERAIMQRMVKAMNEMMALHYEERGERGEGMEWRLAEESSEWVITLEPTIGSRMR